MDWKKLHQVDIEFPYEIERAFGDQTTYGHLVYSIGNDGLGDAPYYARFSGHFPESTEFYRGGSLSSAKQAAEAHNRVWSNRL